MSANGNHPTVGGRPARLDDGERVYAIGDVHGMDDLLSAVHDKIAADLRADPPDRATIVHLGDYVDRGPSSRQVIERLRGLEIGNAAIRCLKGNHEAELLGFLEDPEYWAAHWIRYGGGATLRSYGVDPAGYEGQFHPYLRMRWSLVDRIPPEDLDFLYALPLSFETGDYFFCHAGVRPGKPLDEQVEDDLTWIREAFLTSTMDFGKVVIHGHTPQKAPDVRRNRINIDTTAFASGVLTCLALEGETHRFL